MQLTSFFDGSPPQFHRRALLSAALLAVFGLSTAHSQTGSRGATPGSPLSRAVATEIAAPDKGFAYLADQVTRTGSRRLVTQHAELNLGRDGDHFADLIELDEGSVAASGHRTHDGEHLVVVRVEATANEPRQTELSVPRSSAGNRQISPRLTRARGAATEQEALTLAWLEPTDVRRSQVWAADSEGEQFGQPYLLADAGPGGQIALTGVSRADGAQFYIWSRFDGVDSEIFWVKRDAAEQPGWTAPQRLHPNNEVPDINPTISVHGDQVFAAWSSYDFSLNDGTYRVFLSRFENNQWTEPVPISGAGGIYPRFVAGASLPTISHLNAKEGRWDYRQLDLEGLVLASASTAKASDVRPVVLGETDRGFRLVPATLASGTTPLARSTASVRSRANHQTQGEMVAHASSARTRAPAQTATEFELHWERPQ